MNGSSTTRPLPGRRSLLRLSPWLLGAGLAVTAASGAGAVLSSGDTLPRGSSVAGIDLGGLSPAAAADKLRTAAPAAPTVTVSANGQRWRLKASELGWQVDAGATVAGLADQSGNPARRVFFKLGFKLGLGRPEPGTLKARVDAAQARSRLEALARPFVQSPVNASVFFDAASRRYGVKPDRPGVLANVDAAARRYAAQPGLTALELTLTPLKASVTAGSILPYVTEGNRLMRPLNLRLSGSARSFVLTPLQVANLYWVRSQGIELDAAALEKALDLAARQVGQPARNARFVARAGQLVPVPEQAGLTVERGAALGVLRAAVLQPEVRTVELPAQVEEPALTTSQLPDPSALSLMATGSSSYFGSSRARATNVAVAARKLNGYVIPAGAEFSFLNAVGHITEANGFASALVISSGRTVEGIGGGVCQVSTTTFRALYSAGLPIVERNQHAYRVHWYDPQIGFEAAVYDPGVDLRMKNDTGAPLLIRTFNDALRGQLDIKLYGAPLSREVTVSPAVITSHTAAPRALYTVNPALRPGQRRQVDWAADGYNLFIVRTVTDAAGTRSDKLSTSYKPWQAVYELGPARPVPVPNGTLD